MEKGAGGGLCAIMSNRLLCLTFDGIMLRGEFASVSVENDRHHLLPCLHSFGRVIHITHRMLSTMRYYL